MDVALAGVLLELRKTKNDTSTLFSVEKPTGFGKISVKQLVTGRVMCIRLAPIGILVLR